jgi:hypothetical protein
MAVVGGNLLVADFQQVTDKVRPRPFVDDLQKFWLRWSVTVDRIRLTSRQPN